MQSRKVAVFFTGCRAPADVVVKTLESVLATERNYLWSLDVDEVTGKARLLCFEHKGKKEMLVEGVQANIREPLNGDRLFSQIFVELVVVGVVKPLLVADKIYKDIFAFADDFQKSFSGYHKRQSVFFNQND